jgi:hypothetical protein
LTPIGRVVVATTRVLKPHTTTRAPQKNEQQQFIWDQLVAIQSGEIESPFSFPGNYSSEERKYVHFTAKKLGLTSKSSGSKRPGAPRVCIVSRSVPCRAKSHTHRAQMMLHYLISCLLLACAHIQHCSRSICRSIHPCTSYS